MIPQRVSLITLGVSDLAAARAFYARLGWVEHVESQPGIAFFQLAGQVLGLFPRAELAKDMHRAGEPLFAGAVTLAQNFTTEGEVDAAFASALAAGGRALKAPEKVFWGGYSGYWADPEGHVWEVAMNPFWPLGPGGSVTLPGGIEEIAEADLSAEDDQRIAALLARCFTTDFGGRSFFNSRHHLRLLIRDGDGVAAHMALQVRAMRLGDRLVTVAGLAEVATAPEARGKGLATALLQAAIARARSSRAEYLLLFGATGLYAAQGFAPARNPMTYVDMRGARTATVRVELAEVLMVLPLGAEPWDETAPLDLLGPLF